MCAGPGGSIIEGGGVGEVSSNDQNVLRGVQVLLDVEGCGEADYTRAGMSQCYIFGLFGGVGWSISMENDVPDDYYGFFIHFA